MRTIVLKTEKATRGLAVRLAARILQTSIQLRQARIVGLTGDLGTGKTTFIKAFVKIFHVKQKIFSPTFLIFRVYDIPKKFQQKFKKIYHIDLYRINSISELKTVGFHKILKNPENLVLIEWVDRIRDSLPKNTIWLLLEHGKNINERQITFKGQL